MKINVIFVSKRYDCLSISVRKKRPYSEFFWPVSSRIPTEYGEMRSISPYSVQMRENTDQKNSKSRHFSSCDVLILLKNALQNSKISPTWVVGKLFAKNGQFFAILGWINQKSLEAVYSLNFLKKCARFLLVLSNFVIFESLFQTSCNLVDSKKFVLLKLSLYLLSFIIIYTVLNSFAFPRWHSITNNFQFDLFYLLCYLFHDRGPYYIKTSLWSTTNRNLRHERVKDTSSISDVIFLQFNFFFWPSLIHLK